MLKYLLVHLILHLKNKGTKCVHILLYSNLCLPDNFNEQFQNYKQSIIILTITNKIANVIILKI